MHKIAIAGYRHCHVKELLDFCQGTAEVVACCGMDPEFAELLAKNYPAVRRLDGTVSEMLQSVDCDIVALGDAYGNRGAAAILALKAGKHVIADKPLCTSLSELAEIRRLAAEKHLSVGLMLPLWSMANATLARKMVAEGRIGKLVDVVFTGQHPLNYGVRSAWYWDKKLHGGTINDLASHGIDVVEYVAGAKFDVPLYARTWNQEFPQVPHFGNCAQFAAKLDNGAGVMADVSYNVGRFDLPSYWRFGFWGTEGWIEFSCAKQELLYAGKTGAVETIAATEGANGYWQSYLAELEGGVPAYFSTEHVLHISEFTLQVQSLADKA